MNIRPPDGKDNPVLLEGYVTYASMDDKTRHSSHNGLGFRLAR